MNIGEKIVKARKEKGMTQAELGSELHVTFQAVSKWERGESSPDFETICNMANILEVPVSYFENSDEKEDEAKDEIFEKYIGNKLFMRGPYGNGFDVNLYKNKDIIIIAGGTGVSPVRAVIDYFSEHKNERKDMTVIIGFKSPSDILFKEDIEKWKKNTNLILTVDGADEGYKENIGLVTKYIPDLKIKDINVTVAIVV